jgi:hypothetical protein
MKKTLLTLALAGLIGLGSCSNKQKFEETKGITIKPTTEMKIHPAEKEEYMSNEYIVKLKETSKANEEYIQSFVENSEFFNNYFNLSQTIFTELKHKQHTPRIEKNYQNTALTEHFSQIYDLSLSQSQRIYLMLKSLKNQDFLNRIGKIIEEDVQDKYSEHGGIITINPNLGLELRVIQSEDAKEKIEENNSFYNLSDWENFTKNISKFHLHAMSYDESKFAGPGSQDLIIADTERDIVGKTNEFIITSLKKGKFNIDYVGGDKLINKQVKVIDLGNYEYFLQK